MGMTIDEAILQLEECKAYKQCDTEKDLNAFDVAITTMRKYQQLQADYENRLKKGKWIAHRKSNGEVGYFQCTSCDHHSVVKFPYCPICGAEMDCNPNILSEMKAIPRDMYENRLKADMVAMLIDLKNELIDKSWNIDMYDDDLDIECCYLNDIDDVINQKINELKAEQEGKE